MKRTPITQQGANQLREELRRLESEDRPNVIRAIAEARVSPKEMIFAISES